MKYIQPLVHQNIGFNATIKQSFHNIKYPGYWLTISSID